MLSRHGRYFKNPKWISRNKNKMSEIKIDSKCIPVSAKPPHCTSHSTFFRIKDKFLYVI